MLGILSDIFDIFANIPDYILYAIETFINGIFSVVELAVSAAVLALPTIPEISPPPFLPEINWFFPIGTILSVLVTMTAAYGVWLGVRWLFKWAGDL